MSAQFQGILDGGRDVRICWLKKAFTVDVKGHG